MPMNIATIRAELTGAPSYRIASSGGTTFAILGMGALHLTSDDPTELRRLADVAANAADVLEAAQAAARGPVPLAIPAQERRPASKCCGFPTHDRMRNVPAVWATLEYVGVQDDGAGGQLELRTCDCGTTLARQVEAGGMAREAG